MDNNNYTYIFSIKKNLQSMFTINYISSRAYILEKKQLIIYNAKILLKGSVFYFYFFV